MTASLAGGLLLPGMAFTRLLKRLAHPFGCARQLKVG